jgi:hypothetical protein
MTIRFSPGKMENCGRLTGEEAFNSNGAKGFSNMQKNRATWPPLFGVPVDPSNKAGQL